MRDTTPPKVSLTAAATTIRAALTRGLRVSVGCNEPCRVQIQARLGTARVGTANGVLARTGRVSVVLKLTQKAALAKARTAVVTLVATAVDAAGNRGTARRTVRLTR